jgi:hypothetical protein
LATIYAVWPKKRKSKVLKVPPTPTTDEISPQPAKGAIAFRCASALSFT